jgi:isoleucyl-tRNA synthetase
MYEPYRRVSAAEATAFLLLEYNNKLKQKLEEENLSKDKLTRLYEACESCAIYLNNMKPVVSEEIFRQTGEDPKTCLGLNTYSKLKEEKIIFYSDSECKGYINFGKTLKNIEKNSLEELRQKLYEIDEKVRTDPESIKRQEELARKLGTLTQEDLNKRMTI